MVFVVFLGRCARHCATWRRRGRVAADREDGHGGDGEETPHAPRHAADPGDVLMAAGRPVLVVPPELPRGKILSHVIVGWKDTRESRRAVVDALPLLRKAGQTTVVGVGETGDEEANRRSVDDVVAFIRLHGVDAAPLALSAGDQAPAQCLIDCAWTKRAGLIVLGGYGHARASEWVFGGVTRSMLKASPICCLFSH